jgi:hypothetical protein
MRYPKGSVKRENYRDRAAVYFAASSRSVALSQMEQFEF